jgi:hypothetical protein
MATSAIAAATAAVSRHKAKVRAPTSEMRTTLAAKSVCGLGTLFALCEQRIKCGQCGAAHALELRAAIGFVGL